MKFTDDRRKSSNYLSDGNLMVNFLKYHKQIVDHIFLYFCEKKVLNSLEHN